MESVMASLAKSGFWFTLNTSSDPPPLSSSHDSRASSPSPHPRHANASALVLVLLSPTPPRPRPFFYTMPAKEAKDGVLSAIDDAINRTTFNLESPAVSEQAWADLDSPPALVIEELMRDGRQATARLYCSFMKGHLLPLGAYDTIWQKLFTHRTFKRLLERPGSPLGSSEAGHIYSQFFFLWVAALETSLEPTVFTAWFGDIFGPLIEAAEHQIAPIRILSWAIIPERHCTC
ncbi:hypothetical protein B0H13DRAFT_40317 [Mycena leptocephala]|nr:hypothetical protein B0H13DRAFT_40317 [Mycena leptocephala]